MQGYWAKASWGFPKGKVNEEESCEECAIREVTYIVTGLYRENAIAIESAAMSFRLSKHIDQSGQPGICG